MQMQSLFNIVTNQFGKVLFFCSQIRKIKKPVSIPYELSDSE